MAAFSLLLADPQIPPRDKINIMEPVFSHPGMHVVMFLAGSTAAGLIGHAVNTFPVPNSPIGKWLLGVIQFAVGQRIQALQTRSGNGPTTPQQ